MAESSAVVAKTLATAAQYNNLRNDVLSTTLGHVHDGINAADDIKPDGITLKFGTGSDAGIVWDTGDASNHTLVIALGNSNQALHITDLAAVSTDWNVGADTHPTLYIHSNTTPDTDYLRIGAHDGTTALLDVVGGTTLDLNIAGTTAAALTATALTLSDAVEINMQEAIVWTATGAAVTSTDYSIGRDSDNFLTYNVPTGSGHYFRVNGSTLAYLDGTSMQFTSTVFPVLPKTDTNGTVEGSIWYDASEDKLKFKTAAGVETITSA